MIKKDGTAICADLKSRGTGIHLYMIEHQKCLTIDGDIPDMSTSLSSTSLSLHLTTEEVEILIKELKIRLVNLYKERVKYL